MDLGEGDVFVAEEGGEAGSLGHVEEVVEGEGGGGGVVEDEGFEEPERGSRFCAAAREEEVEGFAFLCPN